MVYARYYALFSVFAGRTWTTALATVATFTTGTTVASGRAFATGATFAAGCADGFHIAFGLGLQRTHRKAVLAGFLVDFDEFD